MNATPSSIRRLSLILAVVHKDGITPPRRNNFSVETEQNKVIELFAYEGVALVAMCGDINYEADADNIGAAAYIAGLKSGGSVSVCVTNPSYDLACKLGGLTHFRPPPTLIVEDADLPPEPGEVTVVAVPAAIAPKRRAGRPKSGDASNRKKDRTRLAEAAMKNCPENCLARDVHRVLLAMMDRGDDSALLPSDLAIIQEETNIKGMTPTVLKLNAGKLVTALVAHDANLTTTQLVTEEAKVTKDLTNWFDRNFRGREASKEHPRLPKHALGILKVALRELGHGKYRAA